MPSITGSAAAGPMSPRPSTAVPSVTTATSRGARCSGRASVGVRGDRLADPGDAGRVGERQDSRSVSGSGAADRELAALVHARRPGRRDRTARAEDSCSNAVRWRPRSRGSVSAVTVSHAPRAVSVGRMQATSAPASRRVGVHARSRTATPAAVFLEWFKADVLARRGRPPAARSPRPTTASPPAAWSAACTSPASRPARPSTSTAPRGGARRRHRHPGRLAHLRRSATSVRLDDVEPPGGLPGRGPRARLHGADGRQPVTYLCSTRYDPAASSASTRWTRSSTCRGRRT